MTIREIAESLGKLEKTSVSKWEKHIRFAAKTQAEICGDGPFYVSVALPDGQWWCKIQHYGKKAGDWQYTIPETREQEARMLGLA